MVLSSNKFVIDGRTLDIACRRLGDPHCVSDLLLRWHFRQSVLANMRGAGEPVFEHDFPPDRHDGRNPPGAVREGGVRVRGSG